LQGGKLTQEKKGTAPEGRVPGEVARGEKGEMGQGWETERKKNQQEKTSFDTRFFKPNTLKGGPITALWERLRGGSDKSKVNTVYVERQSYEFH